MKQCLILLIWLILWAVICLLLGVLSHAKKADGGTSHCGGREIAADPSGAPLVEALGGGWSELYEKLDMRTANLKEETPISEDDERHNQSDTGHVVPDAETAIDVTSIAEDRRRREKAMSNYLNLIR